MRLDDAVKLPSAGAALLALHRWLLRQHITERSAFDLLDYLCRQQPLAEDAAETIAMLAEDDERARAAIGLLDLMVRIERLEAVAKSMGASVEISERLARQFDELRRLLGGEGGAK